MIEGSAVGATRLLEALEKLASWAGQAHGDAPSGAPSQEIVQAFEAAMQADESAGAFAPSSVSASAVAPQAASGDGVSSLGVTTDMVADDAIFPHNGIEHDPAMAGQVSGIGENAVVQQPAFSDGSTLSDAAQGQVKVSEPLSPGPADRIYDASGFFTPDSAATSNLAPGSASMGTVGSEGGVHRGSIHGGLSLDRYAPTISEAAAPTSAPTSAQDALHELGSLVEQMGRSGAQVSPDTLFRVQYLVGMLKLQVQTGFQASQQGSQGLENLLRQSG